MLLAVLLLPVELSAQSRRDKEQTYVLDQPYEVTKITPPQGKKIKNVILMIGDGMESYARIFCLDSQSRQVVFG